METTQDKAFIKKTVTKITIITIGSHIIYKFVNWSGLYTKIHKLLVDSNRIEIIKD